MMDVELNSWMLFRNAERSYRDVEIVTQLDAEERHRYTYASMADRVRRLISALDALKIPRDTAVGTLAWNSFEHLECYFGIPNSTRVIHTINSRLPAEDLAYIINDAGDQALFVAPTMLELVSKILPDLPEVKHVISFGKPAVAIPGLISYEELLASVDPFEGELDIPESSPFGMCYTSGTTGRPKGVLFTHRSTTLHSMAISGGPGIGISASDCVLPIVPMFHVNAWGLPFSAVSGGAKIAFSTPTFQPATVIRLIREEAVTKAAGVPTIWIAVLDELRRSGGDLGELAELICGGAQPPASLIRAYLEEYGVSMLQAWGLTESSPVATTTRLPHRLRNASIDEKVEFSSRAGKPVIGIDLALLDKEGRPAPRDGSTMADIYLRGPWVIDSYRHNADPDAFNVPGWFKTGDVGVVEPNGLLRLVDRSKDLIKSGGEWISSVSLESALMGHPKIIEAAVVAYSHDRWQERPLAVVVPFPGETVTLEEVRKFLESEGIPRWQLPDRVVFVPEIPRTSVGKFDKKLLRGQYGEEIN